MEALYTHCWKCKHEEKESYHHSSKGVVMIRGSISISDEREFIINQHTAYIITERRRYNVVVPDTTHKILTRSNFASIQSEISKWVSLHFLFVSKLELAAISQAFRTLKYTFKDSYESKLFLWTQYHLQSISRAFFRIFESC